MLKRCSSCEVEKPIDDFTAPHRCCKPCRAAKNSAWYHKNKERARAQQNSSKFGLTVDEYLALIYKQRGLCAICEETCSSGRRLAVDHDHATGRVQALLCSNCNTALGKLRDNPTLARRAAAYLETHNGIHSLVHAAD